MAIKGCYYNPGSYCKPSPLVNYIPQLPILDSRVDHFQCLVLHISLLSGHSNEMPITVILLAKYQLLSRQQSKAVLLQYLVQPV